MVACVRDWILKLDLMLILDLNSKFRNLLLLLKLDLMLILDLNSKFRNLLNLDIHNFTLVPHKISPTKLGYPWVVTPLGNVLW